MARGEERDLTLRNFLYAIAQAAPEMTKLMFNYSAYKKDEEWKQKEFGLRSKESEARIKESEAGIRASDASVEASKSATETSKFTLEQMKTDVEINEKIKKATLKYQTAIADMAKFDFDNAGGKLDRQIQLWDKQMLVANKELLALQDTIDTNADTRLYNVHMQNIKALEYTDSFLTLQRGLIDPNAWEEMSAIAEQSKNQYGMIDKNKFALGLRKSGIPVKTARQAELLANFQTNMIDSLQAPAREVYKMRINEITKGGWTDNKIIKDMKNRIKEATPEGEKADLSDEAMYKFAGLDMQAALDQSAKDYSSSIGIVEYQKPITYGSSSNSDFMTKMQTGGMYDAYGGGQSEQPQEQGIYSGGMSGIGQRGADYVGDMGAYAKKGFTGANEALYSGMTQAGKALTKKSDVKLQDMYGGY